MYDITDIISKLQTDTGYTIKRATHKEPTLTDITTMPIVYVGYRGLDSESPTTPLITDMVAEHGEDLVQSFDIQINCMEVGLADIQSNIFKALIGWNPLPLEDQFTGFSYKFGGVIGLENGRMWWLDVWQVGYPSLYMFP